VSTARDAILIGVRDRLRGAHRPSASVSQPTPGIPLGDRPALFTAQLERVGGRVRRARDLAQAAGQVRVLLAEARVRSWIVSDAPAARALAEPLRGAVELLEPSAPRAALLAADAGLSSAQWGIAETGTLVLESARERHRLASLLAPLHIAILPVSRLLGTLGEALTAVRTPQGAPASRTITFVTGPSRTADIELELVVGVHGPKSLHVLLLDDPA
jgi:L-lactate dehydrogenase complex protein LldG